MKLPSKVHIEEDVDGFFASIEEPLRFDDVEGIANNHPDAGYQIKVSVSCLGNCVFGYKILLRESDGIFYRSDESDGQMKSKIPLKELALDLLLGQELMKGRDEYVVKQL